MNFYKKYKKYKDKYNKLKQLNILNILKGGAYDVTTSGNFKLSYNIFDEKNKDTSYPDMIKLPKYDNTLFIFNDNVEYYKSIINGSGNANIREHINNLRSWGIPTGTLSNGGFTGLTQVINPKTAKNYIDDAIQDIKAVIWKRSTTTNPVQQIIYSGFEKKQIYIEGIKIPYLAMAIFTFSDDINEYIITKLYEVYKFMQKPTDTSFTYSNANTYEYKTASVLPGVPAVGLPVVPTNNTDLQNSIDLGFQNTGSINIQLNVNKDSPLHKYIVELYIQITSKKPPEDFSKNFHISLFTIIFYKYHPYIQTQEFIDKLTKLQDNLDCITQKINTNQDYKDIKDNLAFTTNNEFDIFGDTKIMDDRYFVEKLKGQTHTNVILKETKTVLCKYLFGDTIYVASEGTGQQYNLDKTKFSKDDMYYFKKDNSEALYKIKKDDPTFESHISITKLRFITKLDFSLNKNIILQKIKGKITPTQSETKYDFTNFKFLCSNRGLDNLDKSSTTKSSTTKSDIDLSEVVSKEDELKEKYEMCDKHFTSLTENQKMALNAYQGNKYKEINEYLHKHSGKLNPKDFDMTYHDKKELYEIIKTLLEIFSSDNKLVSTKKFFVYRNFNFGNATDTKQNSIDMANAPIGNVINFNGLMSVSATKNGSPIIKANDIQIGSKWIKPIGTIIIPKNVPYICTSTDSALATGKDNDEEEIILHPGTLTKINNDDNLGIWLYTKNN
jgi:hypothetical protein